MKRFLVPVLLLGGLLATSSSMAPGAVHEDYSSSDNVTLTDRIKTVGDGVGAKVVGPYMYVTTTKSLTIFDIKTDPAHPKQVGQELLNVEFENEEVPTNGKILGISGQIGCPDPTSSNLTNTSGEGTGAGSSSATGCLTLYDVSNPEAIKQLKVVAGAGQHTSACIFECTWFYGSTGAITDARNPSDAKLVGTWTKAFPPGYFKASCHHLREIVPGVLLGSCQPLLLLSVRPEDGGSILKPVVIATGTNQDNRFIHSSRWPRDGRDKFVLVGG